MSWKNFLKEQLAKVSNGRHACAEEADLLFRRKTNRYAPKGSIARNKGYLKVGRNEITGRFESLK
jgi:hypothetical protein